LFDPAVLRDAWPLVLVLTVLVISGKTLFVTIGSFLTGNGVRTSVQTGLSLAQIGEFSFIMAGLGLSLNATGSSLYPVAIAVSALTTLTTPALIRASPRIADLVDRKLPHRVQTLVSLYGSWLERLRAPRAGFVSPIRKLVRLLLLDAAVMVATLIALSMLAPRLAEGWPRFTLIGVGVVGLAIVGFGLARVLRALGDALARRALPEKGRVDLARAPRAALAAAFRVIAVILVVAPALALLSPFLHPAWVMLALVVVLLALLVSFWRRATDFEGHLQAGAQVIAAALSSGAGDEAMEAVRDQLPGLGEPMSCKVPPESGAVGRSLAELNLRGLTGATVLAIHRESGDVVLPTATERLNAGDLLALAGTTEAVAAARELIGALRIEASANPALDAVDPQVQRRLRETGVDLGMVVVSRPSDWEIYVIDRSEGRVVARASQHIDGRMTWTLEPATSS
ncbi:MAG: cation:proton antiporter, partial [Archangium sp.]|nr:cation:proton antiporter [Archangium sp.]